MSYDNINPSWYGNNYSHYSHNVSTYAVSSVNFSTSQSISPYHSQFLPITAANHTPIVAKLSKPPSICRKNVFLQSTFNAHFSFLTPYFKPAYRSQKSFVMLKSYQHATLLGIFSLQIDTFST